MAPYEANTEAFRIFLVSEGLSILQEQAVNHGYQFKVIDASTQVTINFYTTGTIQVQGKDSALKMKLEEWALRRTGIPRAPIDGPINRNSSYSVEPANIQAIRAKIMKRFSAIITLRLPAQEAEVYRIELQQNADRVTIVQFQTGTLRVQGRSSQLFDELCDALDPLIEQSFADRAARFLPEAVVQTARPFLEAAATQDDAGRWTRTQLGQSLFNFLWSHDQQTIVSGAGILCMLREANRALEEYSPVVMPFGKTFEGFVTKLAIQLELVAKEDIDESAENIKIGDWLREIRNRLPDRRRYEFVANHLDSAWQIRNKRLHADPRIPTLIHSLHEAEQEITTILYHIRSAYDVFITQGIRLKPKPQSNTKADRLGEPVMPHTNTTNPSKTQSTAEQFEDVDIERLATELEKCGYLVKRDGDKTIWSVRTDSIQIFCSRRRPGHVTVRGSKAQDFLDQYATLLQPTIQIVQNTITEDLFPEDDEAQQPH